ncbi:peptidase S41 [Kribbella antibiotica]|uniref:Peptidase S41 n=1 Tax=Kribbella antibiotica TaxID=190195 RepID=A0A4R4ZI07_9ACTN|nr:S41 family peptidase [Kribbella antibiotica]TDD57730.1 peptidase S41 [Kribbella antibiotica]
MTITANLNDRIAALVSENYVFPEVAEAIAAGLADVDTALVDPDETAARLTERLQTVNQDRHLRVRHRPSGALRPADWEQHYAAEAVRNAGGINRVERLEGNTGLLAIAPYTSPVHMAERYIVAAFELLAGVDRLVIDVRAGRGGVPETVALICGYLLGHEPVHLQDLVARDGTIRQFWTNPAAGRLPLSVPISVLTSANTFSGCEELAYNLQAHGRATVIGERTRGGAHPVEIFELTDTLELTIPIARSVNAVTGTNWEQVGVVPDIECPAEEALERASQVFG